jgi:hypothetical protein
MRLADIPTRLIEDTLRKWRRRVIAVAVIAVCALVAVIEGLAAGRLALEAVLGPVGARLVLVGLFLAILAATALVLSRLEAAEEKPAAGEEPFNREERVSLIAEAINLGYMVARDLKKPSADPPAEAPPPDVDAPDRPDRARNGARSQRRAAADA